MNHKFFTNVVIILCGIFSAAFIYYISVNTIFAKSVLPNVYLANEDISLLSEVQLKEKIKAKLLDTLPQEIAINIDGNVVSIPIAELNITVDAYKMISYGKGTDIVKVISEGLGLLKGENAEVSYSIDSSAVLKKLPVNLLSDAPSTFRNDNFLDCKYNQYNFDIDKQKLSEIVVNGLKHGTSVYLKIPEILKTKKDLNIYEGCNKFFNQLPIIQSAINKLNVGYYSADKIFAMKINWETYDWAISDIALYRTILEQYKMNIDVKSDDGEYDLKDLKIILTKQYTYGKNVDINASIDQTVNWLVNPTDNLPIVIIETKPNILTSSLPIEDFTQLYSTGKTRIDLIRNGVTNFVVPYTVYGLDEIDGMVIEPHKEFSYIEAIAPQPSGFTKSGRPIAPGICNSTTTLFRAVLEGGFPVTDRASHADYVPSYEWGYDYNIVDAAYLTNPKVDFKFINDLDYPILIKVSYSKDADYQYNTLSFYTSSKVAKRKIELSNWKIWDQYGKYNFKGSFDRTVSDDKGTIVRQDNFFSQYFALLPGA